MSGGKVIGYSIVLLITFIIEIFLSFRSTIFVREFIIFWIFFIAAIILLFGMGINARWAGALFTVFFALNIINFIHLNNNTLESQTLLFLIALIFSVIGLLVSVFSIPHSRKRVPRPEVVDIKPKKTAAKKTTKKKE